MSAAERTAELFQASVAATIMGGGDDDDDDASDRRAPPPWTPTDDYSDVDVAALRPLVEAAQVEAKAKLAEAEKVHKQATDARIAAEKAHKGHVDDLAETQRAREASKADGTATKARAVKLRAEALALEEDLIPAAAKALAEAIETEKQAAEALEAAKQADVHARVDVEELPILERLKVVVPALVEAQARVEELRREARKLSAYPVDGHPVYLLIRYGVRPAPEPPPPRVQLTVREKEMARFHTVSLGGQAVGVAPFGWLANPLGPPGGSRPDDVVKPPTCTLSQWKASDAPALLADYLLKGGTPSELISDMGVHGRQIEPPRMFELMALACLPKPLEPEGMSTWFADNPEKLGALRASLEPGGRTSQLMVGRGAALDVEKGKAAIRAAGGTKYAPTTPQPPVRTFTPPVPPHVALERARTMEQTIVALRALGRDAEADKAEGELLSLRAQASKGV